MTIPFYDNEQLSALSTLQMGTSEQDLITVSTTALVQVRTRNVIDEQTKPGKNFGRSSFIGIAPVVATIVFTILPDEEDHFFDNVMPLCRQKGRDGVSPPITIVNAQLNRVDVDTVSILSCDYTHPTARDGRQVTIQVREWTDKPTTPKEDTSQKTKTEPTPMADGALSAGVGP